MSITTDPYIRHVPGRRTYVGKSIADGRRQKNPMRLYLISGRAKS